MFIKVQDKPERFVNTDNIEIITFSDNRCVIYFQSNQSVKISESAGRGLLEFTEANQSLMTEPDAFTQHSNLRTQLAQHLRDNAPAGIGLTDLAFIFNTATDKELITALDELREEKVIVWDKQTSKFYHATNAPKAPPLASESEALPMARPSTSLPQSLCSRWPALLFSNVLQRKRKT